MKSLSRATGALLSLLTAVQPIFADVLETGTSTTTIVNSTPERLRDLGVSVNPQLGVSSFDYSEGASEKSNSDLSGGVTFEFGRGMRKMETGLLVMQTTASTYLTIPMAAKLRLVQLGAQTWYGKFGFMPAFEISSRTEARTNNIDVLGSLGAGGRFEFNKKSDFIIEATFNRGVMDALRSSNGDNLNQGFLVLAGMSFNI